MSSLMCDLKLFVYRCSVDIFRLNSYVTVETFQSLRFSVEGFGPSMAVLKMDIRPPQICIG